MQDEKRLHLQAAAQVLAAYRKGLHLKRSYIAKQLQITLATYTKMEQGKSAIEFHEVLQFCQACKITIADFEAAYVQALKNYPAAVKDSHE